MSWLNEHIEDCFIEEDCLSWIVVMRRNNNIPTAHLTVDVQAISIPNDGIITEKASKSPKRIIQKGNIDTSIESCLNVQFDTDAAKNYLTNHGWPLGLINAFIRSCKKIPIRYFICDDSGSMLTNDGHRCVKIQNDNKIVKCSRWSELVSSLTFHSNLAEISNSPTEFRLLNMADPVLIGSGQDRGKSLDAFLDILSESPGGQTPICAQIRDVIERISSIQHLLRQSGQKACVIIATDGESTDGDLASAMRPLESLPVWVVVRLCTDEEKVVQYWNEIDGELELEMDVLDDLAGEADEVFTNNPWLTYTESFHRFREYGATIKEMDLLDESQLSSDQMRAVTALVLSTTQEIPHPDEDWSGFLSFLNSHNQDVWCPKTKKHKKYIDMKRLQQIYGEGKSSQTCSLS